MILRPFCITLLACVLSATPAFAHEGATGVVKDRQDLMDSQKDAMKVIGDMAKSLGCPLPLFNACAPIYTAAMGQGLAKSDTASVCEVIEKMAGMASARKRR